MAFVVWKKHNVQYIERLSQILCFNICKLNFILFKNEKPPNLYIFRDNRIYRLLFEMYEMAKKLISVLPWAVFS